jgi:hypothetical protein
LKYKGFEYDSQILREEFQISLWKVDRFGVVKTKDRYFTPTHECFRQKENMEFDIVPSLDGETIMLKERNWTEK